MFFFDPLYFIIALPGLALALLAQWRVKSAYSKYSQIRNSRNLTGEEVAAYLLRQNGLAGTVKVAGTLGDLSDHYDPRDRTLYLSSDVAKRPSISAVGIVAHEVGHAVQHAENYAPLKFRMAIVPAVNLGTQFGFLIFIAGFFLSVYTRAGLPFASTLLWVGILLISGTAVFSLVTLPVELNASQRALAMLRASALVQGNELGGAQSVLNAAALTYVAAAASAVLNLLYYILLANRVSGRRR